MTTRQSLRLALRRRLEDSAVSPLWDDDTLNDGFASAIRDYSARFPAHRTATVMVGAGSTAIPLTAASQSGGRIVRVIDGMGQTVPRNWSDEDAPPGSQRWRWWEGAIRLDQPAVAGSWQVEYLATRLMPPNDTDPVEVRDGDEAIVVAMAALYALHRRAVEDGKRGHSPSLILTTASTVRSELERELRARMRQVRGGVLPAAS